MITLVAANANVAHFGHIAPIGAADIKDALSMIIESAPLEPTARVSFREHAFGLDGADSVLGRASARMYAIGEAAKPYLGQRHDVDFVEAANAADLLIASDVLLALLLDRKLRGSAKLAYLLGVFLPELFPAQDDEYHFDVTGDAEQVLAIADLVDDAETLRLRPLAAWHDDVLRADFACKSGDEGFVADVALVREQLFETYLGRDCDIPDSRCVSKTALLTCAYAVTFAEALAARATRRRSRAAA